MSKIIRVFTERSYCASSLEMKSSNTNTLDQGVSSSFVCAFVRRKKNETSSVRYSQLKEGDMMRSTEIYFKSFSIWKNVDGKELFVFIMYVDEFHRCCGI